VSPAYPQAKNNRGLSRFSPSENGTAACGTRKLLFGRSFGSAVVRTTREERRGAWAADDGISRKGQPRENRQKAN
jgi:hypothetical protein